jgi:hypothetical protein
VLIVLYCVDLFLPKFHRSFAFLLLLHSQPALLIALCNEHKTLTPAQIARGFADTVEFMEDIKIDIPKAPEYLYKMIGAVAVRFFF